MVLISEKMFHMGSGNMAGLFPVTIMTAIVSPMALPIPRMAAAEIPDIAAGTMTLIVVSQRVAPMARDASLYEWGTECMASSETDMTVGRAMIPRSIEPASQDSLNTSWFSKMSLRKGSSTRTPKNPYTTEGIPAKTSHTGFRMLRILGEAISEM